MSSHNENKHLSNDILYNLKKNQLKDTELINAIEHISQCRLCADKYANIFECHELVEPPANLTKNIINSINNKKSISQKITSSVESKCMLFFYSLRVTLAVSLSLVFLFLLSTNTLDSKFNCSYNIINKQSDFFNSVSNNINQFSKKIIKLEVFSNENKKK